MAANLQGIPAELKSFPNWVAWKLAVRDGKPTKLPYDLKSNGKLQSAKSNDPATWAPFEMAEQIGSGTSSQFDGVGFVLRDTPLIGIDFDGVVGADGVPEPYVLEILKHLSEPYCEFTPSSKGLRAFVRCDEPPPQGKRKFSSNAKEKYGAEIYFGSEPARYLTVTGERYSGDGIPALKSIELPYFLISQITNEKLKSLWMGDLSAHQYDHSSADLALAGMLARLLGGDREKIEAYFGASKLGQRDKWTTRKDYRDMTIDKAILPTTNHTFL
jgi:putative DNA primase/helicase